MKLLQGFLYLRSVAGNLADVKTVLAAINKFADK